MRRFIQKFTGRQRRHRRVRARVSGTAERPRLSVFRSAKHLTAQIIDDDAMKTIIAASDQDAQPGSEAARQRSSGQRKVTIAYEVGRVIAERAKARGITRVIFDRGGYAYHGRVRALADGARAGGLEF